jgi:RNA-directed DNA polymerase
MSLTTPSKIRELQIKLYRKAKNEPGYRFYMLYDKIYREDIVAHAYALARANKGAPGVDGQTFERIESAGLQEWLTGIRQELRNKTYQPQPVRRVMIPKPGGGERPLGIPTIRDRVVQTAAKIVLEPIFEADLEPSAYGYRPKRSAQERYSESASGTWEEARNRLNQMLRGWSAYFSYGTRAAACDRIDHYVYDRVRHFLRRRHQVSSRGTDRFSIKAVFGELGVMQLRRTTVEPRS